VGIQSLQQVAQATLQLEEELVLILQPVQLLLPEVWKQGEEAAVLYSKPEEEAGLVRSQV
jgi:hypothetical protein